MRVAIVGGTGFVGGYVVDALLAAGHEPSVLVRPGGEGKLRQPERCRRVSGDIADSDALARVLADADAAIYLIGILREDPAAGITFRSMQYEGARRCIDVATEQGVRRFLLMSANGVHADGTPYQYTKHQAERYLQKSELAWTIFRPSVIYGDPRGAMEFCTQLRDELVGPPLPAVSFFRGLSPERGAAWMSPVHVEDVARAFVGLLDNRAALDRTFALGGPELLSWTDIVRRIATACGRRKLILPVPSAFARIGATVFDRFPWFPVTRDQLTMLMDGNIVRENYAFDLLGIDPLRMSPDVLDYLRA